MCMLSGSGFSLLMGPKISELPLCAHLQMPWCVQCLSKACSNEMAEDTLFSVD